MTGALWSLFDLNGTASRKRGWIVFGVSISLVILTQLAVSIWSAPAEALLFLAFLASLSMTATTVQRLHEAGRSGYWALLTVIPWLGLIGVIAILLLRPSTTPPVAHPVARRIGTGLMAAAVLVMLTRSFGLWHPIYIPAESMKPTLLIGDFVIVASAGAPERGDVLVFRHPVSGTDYVKRLIGLPGDKVQMRDGVVWLNGAALTQSDAGNFTEIYEPQGPVANVPRCANAPVAMGKPCIRPRLTETLPGGSHHDILNIDANAFTDNTDVFTVPPGKLFFLGDNRDNSLDSRFDQHVGGLGFVPMENVLGQARVIVFSSAGASLADVSSWRSDRYLKVVE